MGASTLISRAATEPVLMGDARLHLRLDTTDSDPILAAYLMGAREWCENYTRRVFITQTWETTFDHYWPTVGCYRKIMLPIGPVASVSSITYLDGDGTEQTLSSSDYIVTGTGADNIAAIVPAYGVTWPSVRCIPDTITVQYVAGYGLTSRSVPQAIRNAILFHTEMMYDRNPTTKDLLESARNSMLDQYRSHL